MSHDDFDFEPVRGLPAALPAGERLLWQGTSLWQPLAARAYHVRAVAIYFVLLGGWTIAANAVDGQGLGDAVLSAAWVPLLLLAAVAPLMLLAWLSARTTVYSLTSRRLMLRIGIALPITFNIPFRQIESVGLRRLADGSGDITLSLAKGSRIAFLVLWPHVRPWHVREPQPMLRCVADVERVAGLLVQAMTQAASEPAARDTGRLRDEAAVPAAASTPSGLPASVAA